MSRQKIKTQEKKINLNDMEIRNNQLEKRNDKRRIQTECVKINYKEMRETGWR